MQPRELVIGRSGGAQPIEPVLVRATRTHHPDVSGRTVQRLEERRHVELRVVRQDTDRAARVEHGAGEVAMGPVDDDLIRIGEAIAGREGGAGIADGHVIAQESSDGRDGGGVVDRAEHQQPRTVDERLEEHGHSVVEPFAAGTEPPEADPADAEGRAALEGQHMAEVGRREIPMHRISGDHERRAHEVRVELRLDDGEQRDGSVRGERRGERLHGQRPWLDPTDEHLDLATAGQADGEGLVIGVAEAHTAGPTIREDLLAEPHDGRLDAAARHVPSDPSIRMHGEHGPRWAWRGPRRVDDGRERERVPLLLPSQQGRDLITHEQLLRRRTPATLLVEEAARSGSGPDRPGRPVRSRGEEAILCPSPT